MEPVISAPEFKGYQKVPRWSRDILITEKIDGTNAQILIEEARDLHPPHFEGSTYVTRPDGSVVRITAGSRSQFLTAQKDNHGFAKWVALNALELSTLGPGRHFGEWWGKGVNRGYGMDHKVFSLFNVLRWSDQYGSEAMNRPLCCETVPVFYKGPRVPNNGQDQVDMAAARLAFGGSLAAPGYVNPEGIVIMHLASNHVYNFTLDGDGHKGAA